VHRRRHWIVVVAGAVAFPLLASPANAAVSHTVEPGETLWSIASGRNFTTRTIAVFNGLPGNARLVVGQEIEIPTEAEGAAALQAAAIAISVAEPVSTATGSSRNCGTETGVDPSIIPSAPGMAHVPSPWGSLHLAPPAAAAWNLMREESLARYGTDLYPSGPLSAHRTYSQQAYLYCLFRSGHGAPANPPGMSVHETGTAVDLATPEMRWVVDELGSKYGWQKVHGPDEWWHIDFVGG
jgi:LysM repeat protein